MATIGLDMLYFAPITEDENGDETYGTPAKLAKAIVNRTFQNFTQFVNSRCADR